jgi:hypothetical protein
MEKNEAGMSQFHIKLSFEKSGCGVGGDKKTMHVIKLDLSKPGRQDLLKLL